LATARQIYEQALEQEVKFSTGIFGHNSFKEINKENFYKQEERAKKLVSLGKTEEAFALADELAEKALRGVEYYRRYHRWQLYALAVISYGGFVAWILAQLLTEFSASMQKRTKSSNPSAFTLAAMTSVALTAGTMAVIGQVVPWHYLIYYWTPVVIWAATIGQFSRYELAPTSVSVTSSLVDLLVMILVVEAMVAGFFYRSPSLPIALLVATVRQIWRSSSNLTSKATFMTFNLALAIFATFPTIGQERNPSLAALASALATMAVLCIIQKFKIRPTWHTLVLLAYLPCSGACVVLASSDLIPKWMVQSLAWLIFSSGLPLATMSEVSGPRELLHVCIALQSAYTLLSLSYEALFFLCLTGTLASWIAVDSST